ncbi:cobalamin biosynthesis protein [Pseudomonas sp. RIT-PI-S]|uniref:cobalamin biosynthesis protein n=1 Tax=Pseudomonas sp. RIT-PI-S TaxID=3035295 RepID=UPI0021D98FB5|nr:cobalamin biosynthesis protein [Pseudomonas sp. RIT-PI-S]
MGDLPWLVAGFGCRQGCPPGQLHALLMRALELAGATLADLTCLATFERRIDAPGLVALAAELALPLTGFAASELAPFEPCLSHRSEPSWRHTGCYGVAESSALARCQALSGATPRLLVARQCSAEATVALACAAPT